MSNKILNRFLTGCAIVCTLLLSGITWAGDTAPKEQARFNDASCSTGIVQGANTPFVGDDYDAIRRNENPRP